MKFATLALYKSRFFFKYLTKKYYFKKDLLNTDLDLFETEKGELIKINKMNTSESSTLIFIFTMTGENIGFVDYRLYPSDTKLYPILRTRK